MTLHYNIPLLPDFVWTTRKKLIVLQEDCTYRYAKLERSISYERYEFDSDSSSTITIKIDILIDREYHIRK